MAFKKVALTSVVKNVLADKDLVIIKLPQKEMIIIKHVPKDSFDLKKEIVL